MGTPGDPPDVGRVSIAGSRRWRRGLIVGTVLLLVIGSMAATGVATHAQEPVDQLLVEVHDDGSATVQLTRTYDLANDAEREAFESLRADETAQKDLRSRFVDRMRSVATAAADRADREMTVSGGSITVETTADGSTGVVTLTVSWSNLAAAEGDRLVIREPFASGYDPADRFVVVAPDGYRIDTAEPAPASSDDAHAVWASGSSLDGFTAAFEPADGAGESRSGGQPGFGLAVAAIALIAAALLATRR